MAHLRSQHKRLSFQLGFLGLAVLWTVTRAMFWAMTSFVADDGLSAEEVFPYVFFYLVCLPEVLQVRCR